MREGENVIPTAILNLELIRETLQKFHSEQKHTNQHFQDTASTLRETVLYGYDYFSLEENNQTFTLIPDYIQTLCQACIDAFGNQHCLGEAQDYKNIIISLFKPGYQLEAHTDVASGDQFSDNTIQKPANFYFGDRIIGVILEVDEEGRFYLLESDSDTYPVKGRLLFELDEKQGLTYLICDRFRRRPFYHGVSKVKRFRMSVTFRTVHLLASEA